MNNARENMRYLSVCSGIEAATVAWGPLGWKPVAFSEVERFPCAVLAYHYPDVPNLGDMTKIDGRKYRGTVDLLVGGTPCQDFSVAGKRAGLSGERSGLALDFIRLAREITSSWILWENVPGCLSTNGGIDFGYFAQALAECGYHLAYRILDAQFFGVPQRRRRIFLVGYFGDWRPAAAVLFERESLCGDTGQRRKTRHVFPCLTRRGYENRAKKTPALLQPWRRVIRMAAEHDLGVPISNVIFFIAEGGEHVMIDFYCYPKSGWINVYIDYFEYGYNPAEKRWSYKREPTNVHVLLRIIYDYLAGNIPDGSNEYHLDNV